MTSSRPNDSDISTRVFVRRVIVASLFVLIGMIGLFARYGFLQVHQYNKYQTNADNNRIKLISDPPSRGYIYDRNGVLLADNVPVFSAVISPDEIEDPAYTLKLLTPIFGLTDEEITDILARIDKSKNNPITIKMDLTEEQIAQFSERKPFFRGVSIQTKLTRVYPHDELFAHVIGYVGRINDKEAKKIAENDRKKALYAGTDLIGKIGIEAQYEEVLLGKPGSQSVETNAHGEILRQLDTKPPVAGNDLYLSLDYGLQMAAQKQLAGRRGAIVALDPKNGDVLAFVSNPSYDPNPFVSGISSKEYGMLRDDIDQPLYNRALQGLYPPASTIKPFESMGFLHYGIMGWNDTIFDPGYFSLPGDSHRFRDWKKGGHGTVNMSKSIIMSVDTYYYKNAHRMGIDKLHDWMSSFGFGKKTGIDLPNEKGGIMPSPKWKMDTYGKEWLPGETISVSIGQGAFLASPLQVANATAMTAIKGKHLTPHLLKRSEGQAPVTIIDKPDGVIPFNGTEADWDRMHIAMEDTVKRGTAKSIYTTRYRMAGKTGTAQVKSIAQGKSYNKAAISSRHWDHAWFSGFAPVDDPQIAIAVIVENGGGGGKVAAPIGRALFDYWILQRETNPITPPSDEELVKIRAAKREAIKAKIAKAEAEKARAKAEEKHKKTEENRQAHQP
ncbi:penicillin-binding protein 2 [Moraxella bovis]|uniref:Peptidoglycan D,D-transpeptidase MrdA n=2 Tax=Moraxella bovis TaxID=476 RepID=A0AAQ2Q2S8_MORBO|nr:penicillin-binding protein 2 [Moraxella bovis]AWY20784.1 penicillin-binding protein 2 [Moraxella bovis]UYZ76535.1 penicillin-binding protein 2 [Moraxella bovis]UYZ77513.1 penicillin-binding protein 2 [Moraxella bovis]UYZ82443.1 penicillin-binding protein 2 [Moraxella bovis]UYZ85999.1 penicillin-binding protein 2 [Moraxella bovis]